MDIPKFPPVAGTFLCASILGGGCGQDNFAMHVSHEFKTPLTAIQGAIELIQEHGNSMPPEQFQKFLANITKDTDRLKILVSRLLELARADVMQPKEERCQLSLIIQSLQSDYQDKGIALVNTSPDVILPMPEDIACTVFGNLIENSRQHGATKVTIGVSSEIGLSITVQDNGQGISPGNVEKLFTPFFTTKRESGGTGLGLVIIRSLLNSYKIDVRYEPSSAGACFVLQDIDKLRS